MKTITFLKVASIAIIISIVAGLSACSSSSDTSSGGGSGPGGGHGVGGMPGSPIMSVGQQIPVGQEVHVHDSGQYPVVVQGQTSMTMECIGRVEYSYAHNGQVENGVCENQTINIPIADSGTMQFNLGQNADMGLELHN